MSTGAWGTEAVERAPIKEIPLINEVHVDGLVSVELLVDKDIGHSCERKYCLYRCCEWSPVWLSLFFVCIP